MTVDDGDTEVVVKAQLEWARFKFAVPVGASFAEAEMPFADAGGGVAGLFQNVGSGLSFGIDTESGL